MPMIAEPPEMTRITVAFVNQPKPGKKKGSIKTADGRYFYAWPKQLAQFQNGRVYDVGYIESGEAGALFRNVETVTPVQQEPRSRPQQPDLIDNRPTNGHAQNGSHIGTRKAASEYWTPKPADPSTARRIFICGLVNAWAHNGRIDMTVEAVSEAVRVAGEAYDTLLAE